MTFSELSSEIEKLTQSKEELQKNNDTLLEVNGELNENKLALVTRVNFHIHYIFCSE